MSRILLALVAAATLGACALPEPTANTAAPPYVEKEVITGSRIPSKSSAQGTKTQQMDALSRDEMLRPKATPIQQ